MNKTYFIDTYGCQMNVADSELVESLLRTEGYAKAPKIDQADAIFVNTCAIREHAEEKVHSQLGRYDLIKQEKPDTIIGVLGCMAQSLKHDLLENRPYVDIILGPDSYRKLPELLNRKKADTKSLVDTTLSRFEVYDDLFPSRENGVNAWISIMRGCDKFCTFCIVPFTRGRERSRPLQGIVDEATKAVHDGFSEITLLGQNVNSYRNEDREFHHLLADVAQIPGLKRVRYTSPHPQDMTDELLETMGQYDTICNYVHLPLQAGNDRILKRMNRTYTKSHFL
ncbi:MAG: MiaB/RimO family radical SAM methylthiotransferase, partial [Candidatus Marinimicrobia bacterium]|nr:MiaB/RimO family radical SAM methylthiotransferase [Candidatus Neomarinimicrobiota bacterium]